MTSSKHGNTKHGHASRGRKSPTYLTWESMFRRCYMPSQDSFKDYGAKGIRVCDRWFSFEAFLEDMGQKPPGLTIDRIDSAANYEPSNCRWATTTEQRINQRRMRSLEHGGLRLTVYEWSAKTGIPSPVIRARIDRLGWDVGRALTEPVVSPAESIKRALARHDRSPTDDYLNALRQGESVADIAARRGVTASAIRKALQRVGHSSADFTQTTEARRARASADQSKIPHPTRTAPHLKSVGGAP